MEAKAEGEPQAADEQELLAAAGAQAPQAGLERLWDLDEGKVGDFRGKGGKKKIRGAKRLLLEAPRRQVHVGKARWRRRRAARTG